MKYFEIDERKYSCALDDQFLANRPYKKGTCSEHVQFSADALPNKDTKQRHHIPVMSDKEQSRESKENW